MRAWLSTILLISSAALAQTPPDNPPADAPRGHLFFGFGLALDQPFGDSLIRHQPMGLGQGFDLAAHYEGHGLIVSADLFGGRFGNDDTYSNPVALSFRAGPVLGEGRFSPYVSAGLSLLAYGAVGDDAASATGLSAEFGVLLFRNLEHLRVTPFLSFYLPLSAGGGKGADSVTSLSWAAAGVRLQI